MGAGRGAACNLHVERAFAAEHVVVFQQPLSDAGQRCDILVRISDLDRFEAALEATIVAGVLEELALDNAPDFVDTSPKMNPRSRTETFASAASTNAPLRKTIMG